MAEPTPEDPGISYEHLRKQLATARQKNALNTAIANLPFSYKVETAFLFLGLITFFVVDEDTQTVQIAGFSDTEMYRMAIDGYNFDPKKFKLSLKTDRENDIVKAITTSQPQATSDWNSLRRHKSDAEATRLNQANSGIAASYVYPLAAKPAAALLFGFFQYPEAMGNVQHEFMSAYSELVSEFLRD